MTVFDNIKFDNIDKFAAWLHNLSDQSFPPWDEWYGHKYCDNCDAVVKWNGYRNCEYSWCELHDGKCKFFQDMDEVPWGERLIKMWLESESDEEICMANVSLIDGHIDDDMDDVIVMDEEVESEDNDGVQD